MQWSSRIDARDVLVQLGWFVCSVSEGTSLENCLLRGTPHDWKLLGTARHFRGRQPLHGGLSLPAVQGHMPAFLPCSGWEVGGFRAYNAAKEDLRAYRYQLLDLVPSLRFIDGEAVQFHWLPSSKSLSKTQQSSTVRHRLWAKPGPV